MCFHFTELASRVSERNAITGLKGERDGGAILSDTLPLNEAALAALALNPSIVNSMHLA